MTNDLEVLAAAVRERRAILFGGAGLSMAVGLPSWTALVDHMRCDLGLADDTQDVSYQTLAEYYRLTTGSIGALRSWMDRHWTVTDEAVQASRIHRLIVELDFPIIYTTNYDRLNFGSPLDMKFRADALARTLLLVGYSMSDLNIRLLLHRLWQTWAQSGYAQHRPPSFVLMSRPDPVQAAVLGQWGVTVLTGEADEPGHALERFLEALKAQVDGG